MFLVISITIVFFNFIINLFTTIKVLKIFEITNFYKDFLIPNSGYKNEKSVGEEIKESGIKRENLFVTSKVWNTEGEGKHLSDG